MGMPTSMPACPLVHRKELPIPEISERLVIGFKVEISEHFGSYDFLNTYGEVLVCSVKATIGFKLIFAVCRNAFFKIKSISVCKIPRLDELSVLG